MFAPKAQDLLSARLKKPDEPTVVRNSFFFVKDTKPDPKPAWVIPGKLAIGSQDCAFSEDTKRLFTHCINVGFDLPNAFEGDGTIIYKKVNVSDLEDFDLISLFKDLHSFIDSAIGIPNISHDGKQPAVLIHCNAGVSRSVTVAASYLMIMRARRGDDPNLDDCLKLIRTVRPSAKPNEGFMSQLRKWELILRDRFTFHFDHAESVRERNQRLIRIANSSGDLARRKSPSLRIRARRILGALSFLYALVRPSVALGSWLSLLIELVRYRDVRSRKALGFFLLALILSMDLLRDDVFRANVFRRLSKGARPGVFFAETSQKMQDMVKRLPSVQRGYRVPALLRMLGGDLTTVSFMLFGYRPQEVPYRREHVSEFDEDEGTTREFTLDWAFPSSPASTASCCCLLLAGIGGNSDSPYIRDVAAKLVDDGMVVAVLLARGLGPCTSTAALDRIYNPTDDGDVHLAVNKLASMYHRVTVVGFSLGGVTTCRYFSATSEDRIPPNVVGGVGVSGAFKIGFIDLPRYQDVYQQVLVPGLVDDICDKYAPELEQRVGSVENIWQSRTYRDLHRELFSNAKIPKVETDYDKWREKLEACASRVHRPLMLLTALDDPLHHPEHLGLNGLWDPALEGERDPRPSDNLLVVVTDSGGHVAWPETGFTAKGYDYLQRVVSEYCHAVIEASVHQD